MDTEMAGLRAAMMAGARADWLAWRLVELRAGLWDVTMAGKSAATSVKKKDGREVGCWADKKVAIMVDMRADQ